MSTDCARPGTARITVTVTEFREIGRDGGCSRADVELTDTAHGAVSQGRINDPIVVTAEVFLDFFVLGREGDRRTYTPIGIAFKEVEDFEFRESKARDEGCSRRDPLGSAAFPIRTSVAKGDTAQLTLFDANPERSEFEYSLIIQRADGALGIIDPRIRNNPIMK
jgi:hypothetical protein